jgi:hypothetical protein
MAYIYFRLVRAGLRTIEQVPERWRAEVAALIAGDEDVE